MADKTVRKLIAEPEFDSVVTFLNALRDDVKNRASLVHEDGNVAAIAIVDSVDLPTLITLVNGCKATYNTHRAKTDAHVAADATNVEAVVDASDLATSITLANDLKAKINLHYAQAGVHINNDANTIATANGTVLADTITLVNAIKANLNAHMARIFSSLKLIRGRA